jgi:hypothetical protein
MHRLFVPEERPRPCPVPYPVAGCACEVARSTDHAEGASGRSEGVSFDERGGRTRCKSDASVGALELKKPKVA